MKTKLRLSSENKLEELSQDSKLGKYKEVYEL